MYFRTQDTWFRKVSTCLVIIAIKRQFLRTRKFPKLLKIIFYFKASEWQSNMPILHVFWTKTRPLMDSKAFFEFLSLRKRKHRLLGITFGIVNVVSNLLEKSMIFTPAPNIPFYIMKYHYASLFTYLASLSKSVQVCPSQCKSVQVSFFIHLL